jgi:hypothetical protein
MSNSINGNSSWTSVVNALAPAVANDVLKVVGTVVPTAAGVYQLLNSAGSPVVLPGNAVVQSVQLAGPALLGGTSYQVGLAATPGGALAVNLSTAVALAAAQVGATQVPAGQALVAPAAASNYPYVVVQSVGITTAGAARVHVLYVLA